LPFSSRQSFVSCVFAAPWFPESLMLFFWDSLMHL
jgi:hypothetical protein